MVTVQSSLTNIEIEMKRPMDTNASLTTSNYSLEVQYTDGHRTTVQSNSSSLHGEDDSIIRVYFNTIPLELGINRLSVFLDVTGRRRVIRTVYIKRVEALLVDGSEIFL